MSKLYIMCGVPGSGKSSWIANHMDDIPGTVSVQSRDMVRFSLVKEDEPYFSKEKEVFDTWTSKIKKDLKIYDNVIADATHLNAASRTKLLRKLGESLKGVEIIAIMIETPLETCLERNALRSGREKVPEEQVVAAYKRKTKPKFEEGIDVIITYNSMKKYKYYIEERG